MRTCRSKNIICTGVAGAAGHTLAQHNPGAQPSSDYTKLKGVILRKKDTPSSRILVREDMTPAIIPESS